MEESINAELLEKYIAPDVMEKIMNTPFFKRYSEQFLWREKMLPETYDVVRNNFFDMERLGGIASQKHLLIRDSRIILDLLQQGIQLTRIVPNCWGVEYLTSVKSQYQSTTINIKECEHIPYKKGLEVFNVPYHTIYQSIVKGPQDNWLLEHNALLTEEEIKRIKKVFAMHTAESDTSI